ncbi:hypothetical protein GTY65_39105 [Streptomyces sp. SID8379]|uniref:hypothetical protein n=1 Tax=unclassified Streptomyces TaxID=2593676 RepID=UPI0003738A29|nr:MULTISPECIES: hypothetical protein [unclassified Streptomyces]MYW70021.1 hypothetical protein [Streptomyces sp. SID8379]
MPALRHGRPLVRTRIATDRAEAALVAQYTALVRLAYLTLPATLSRHRRVLLAHGAAQRALPGTRTALVPRPRGPHDDDVVTHDALRVRVLRGALSAAHRPTGWPGALPPPRALVPRLPVVWGLRLFPRAGGAEEITLGQALADAPAPTRAAFVLRRVDGLPDRRVAELLAAAGVSDAGASVRESATLDAAAGAAAEALLRSQEFDACSVQTRPTDLVRRSRRKRAAWIAGAVGVAAVAALLVPQATQPDRPTTAARATTPRELSADRLVRADAGQWADTSRVDFTVWPARGDRKDDEELLTRALGTWAAPTTDVKVTATPGTAVDAPPRTPQLLYAGEVGGRAVVLFSDGERLARYTDADGDEPATLDLARVDDADVTTAAVVVLARSEGSARYLTAPWVAESTTRDLLRPDSPARELHVSQDGVTDAVPVAGASGCDRRPVLQLRSSSRIVEHHAFVVADLGGLSPVHLTYTPLPGHGTPPPRQPREATSAQALLAWARGACGLGAWHGGGVRAVNAWDFAEQDLPEGGGHAVWTCARASTWRGPGDVSLLLRTPAASVTEPARVVGQARDTAACSRFGQHVVASTRWKSPKDHWFLLAAGSRAVTRITASGAVDAARPGRTMAVRAPAGGTVRVTALLDAKAGGEKLAEVGPVRR